MTVSEENLDEVLVIERERWPDGPPHELFKRMRSECPVHWTSDVPEFPESAGFWSITTADDVHTVSRDWQTYSSEKGGIVAVTANFPLELMRAMFIGMDPPKHDRVKALFQAGFTPKRIAAHEDEIRRIVSRRARPARGPRDLRPRHRRRPGRRLAGDRQLHGDPARGRRDVGGADERALGASDPDLNPDGVEGAVEKTLPEIFERCNTLIAERRENPTDDLTSVLVHAEVEGEKLEDHEIVMGFFLLMAAGNDSTKATYASGMRALIENPDQRQLLLDDPSLIPSAVEESLRMFPAFAHFRRTATARHRAERPGDQGGRQGRHVVRLLQPRRDALRGPRPLRRHPQSRAPGVRRRRPPLLPRHRAGPARAEDPVRGDAGPLPGDGDSTAGRCSSNRPSSTS